MPSSGSTLNATVLGPKVPFLLSAANHCRELCLTFPPAPGDQAAGSGEARAPKIHSSPSGAFSSAFYRPVAAPPKHIIHAQMLAQALLFPILQMKANHLFLLLHAINILPTQTPCLSLFAGSEVLRSSPRSFTGKGPLCGTSEEKGV